MKRKTVEIIIKNNIIKNNIYYKYEMKKKTGSITVMRMRGKICLIVIIMF